MASAACIIYHKNARKIYRKEWIDLCVDSILKQSFQDFDIYELEYSAGKDSVIPKGIKQKHVFYSIEFPNFVQGMNFLLDEIFSQENYECVFNVNLDDYYSLSRFSKQYHYIKGGYDLISCNWCYIDENNKMIRKLFFSDRVISRELSRGNNVIAHPAVCYSRKFWLKSGKYNDQQIPEEDLKLWQRTIGRFKFLILPENLLFHRIHANKVTQSSNR